MFLCKMSWKMMVFWWSEIYCKSGGQNPHGWRQFEIKGNSVVHFVRDGERNNSPAKQDKPYGKWFNQFQKFWTYELKIVPCFLISRGLQAPVNDLHEMQIYRLANHRDPDWLPVKVAGHPTLHQLIISTPANHLPCWWFKASNVLVKPVSWSSF